ncbi:MAG: hypothetical protein OQK73_02700 [Gammaproteobacteria bacterium]|nr:hypothetical protein [Gammaproteobacteria bacterium]
MDAVDTIQYPVIMDLEASGFGFDSYPIEIGIALEDSSTRCYLIRPQTSWVHWDTEGEELHGISRDTLLRYGTPADVIARELNRLLNAKTVYSDGWGNDISWLYRMYDAVSMLPSFRLETLPKLISRHQMSIWDKTKKEIFDQGDFQRHRASNDARVLQLTYQRTRTVESSNHTTEVNSDI